MPQGIDDRLAAAGSQNGVDTTMQRDDDLRARGMRDLGPDEMRRFRNVERRFLDTVAAAGYAEIRTPTIEPLHLFTASGSLSPQLLDRAYSFLDWDGWSGERVVLRPDGTVPAARWYRQAWTAPGPARLCYVQAVYRFEPGDGQRQQWQCGVELFGLPAAEADTEVLLLSTRVLHALGIDVFEAELAHAGLVRALLASAGLAPEAQAAAFERLLAGEAPTTGGEALRLLTQIEGGGHSAAAYMANVRSALPSALPEAARALDELAAAATALSEAGIAVRFRPATSANFEYYTGLTFRLTTGGDTLLAGGRYDGLVAAIGGAYVPGCGFGADLLGLAERIR